MAWAAVNIPVAVLAPDNWSWFFVFSRQRPANPETIWNIALYASDYRILDGRLAQGQSPDDAERRRHRRARPVRRRRRLADPGRPAAAPRSPRSPSCCVAGFLLLNKVWSPQYSLWLLPLAVLARPRWRSLLLWQATEVLVWVVAMLATSARTNRGIGSSGSSSGWRCATSPSSR